MTLTTSKFHAFMKLTTGGCGMGTGSGKGGSGKGLGSGMGLGSGIGGLGIGGVGIGVGSGGVKISCLMAKKVFIEQSKLLILSTVIRNPLGLIYRGTGFSEKIDRFRIAYTN